MNLLATGGTAMTRVKGLCLWVQHTLLDWVRHHILLQVVKQEQQETYAYALSTENIYV